MLRYLHIEYMDGLKEVVQVTDSFGAVRVEGAVLIAAGGDGSYRTRLDTKGFPLHNIRRWWQSDSDAH